MQVGHVFGAIQLWDKKQIIVAQRRSDRHWVLPGGDVGPDMDAEELLAAYAEGQMGWACTVLERIGPAYEYAGAAAVLHALRADEMTEDETGACPMCEYRNVTLAEALSLPFADPTHQRMALDALCVMEPPMESSPELPPHERPEGAFVSPCGKFLHVERPDEDVRRTWVRVEIPGATDPAAPPLPL